MVVSNIRFSYALLLEMHPSKIKYVSFWGHVEGFFDTALFVVVRELEVTRVIDVQKMTDASTGYSAAVKNKLQGHTIIKMDHNSIFLSKKKVMNKNKIYSAVMHT